MKNLGDRLYELFGVATECDLLSEGWSRLCKEDVIGVGLL